jgi:vanillate O-demethylase monooxygenase subunit
VHRGSFGGKGYINAGKLELRDLGEEIHANWWMPGVPAHDPKTGAKTDMKIDHFLDMRWHAPAIMRLHISLMPAGALAGRENTLREDLPGQFAAHILTSETASTTHYFWSSNHPTDLNSEMTKEAGHAGHGELLF